MTERFDVICGIRCNTMPGIRAKADVLIALAENDLGVSIARDILAMGV